MKCRGSVLVLVILGTLGCAYSFQEKSPVQSSVIATRNDKQVVVSNSDESLSSGRVYDENYLKTIGKGNIKLVVGQPSTTKPPPHEHQHYYYPEEHPRQYGQPHYHYPPPWYQQQPNRPPPIWPPYGGGWGGGGGGWGGGGWGGGGWGGGGWGGGGWGPGYGGGWGGWPGYGWGPGWGFRAASTAPEPDQLDFSQQETFGSPGFQARYLSTGNPGSYLDGKSTTGAVPLYRLLNMGRL